MKVCRSLTSRECDRLRRLAERARSQDVRVNGPDWTRLYARVAVLYADGVGQSDLGRALGVSKQRVGQMVRQGREASGGA